MQKSFLGSGIPIPVPQTSTSLANLTDVQLTTPTNNQVLTFSGSKWINGNSSSAVQSVFGRVNNVVANSGDYSIGQITNSSILADSNNLNIIAPAEADSLIYSAGKWINKKKYGELFNYVNINPGDTVTAVAKTIYFCNLATINFSGSSELGSIVKVINTNGPLLTINFPGIILYFNSNNFNCTLTTTDSCEIVFEKILGNSWQVVSYTGKILNSVTGKNLCSNDINDLRNVSISSPSTGQVISYNGSNFVNSNLPSAPVLSVFGRTNNIVATEGDYSLNLLSDCAISSPAVNDTLIYNGSNFVNSQPTTQFIILQSSSNLVNNGYILQTGVNLSYGNAFIAAPRFMTIKFMTVYLQIGVTIPIASRTFEIFKNGLATGNLLTFVNGSGSFLRVATNVVCILQDTFSVRQTSSGPVANTPACVTLEYN